LAVDEVNVGGWGMVEDVTVFDRDERVVDDGEVVGANGVDVDAACWDDVVDGEELVRAFWFHVTALGCAGSWLIVKIVPVIFWWLPSGST